MDVEILEFGGNHDCWENWHCRSLFVVEAVPSKTFVNALAICYSWGVRDALQHILWFGHCYLFQTGISVTVNSPIPRPWAREPCTQSHSVLT